MQGGLRSDLRHRGNAKHQNGRQCRARSGWSGNINSIGLAEGCGGEGLRAARRCDVRDRELGNPPPVEDGRKAGQKSLTYCCTSGQWWRVRASLTLRPLQGRGRPLRETSLLGVILAVHLPTGHSSSGDQPISTEAALATSAKRHSRTHRFMTKLDDGQDVSLSVGSASLRAAAASAAFPDFARKKPRPRPGLRVRWR